MLWLLSLLHPLVLGIREGKVSVVKGRIPSPALREIQGVIADAGVVSGSIHGDGARRIHFSGTIPAGDQQRLRNILASL